MKHLPNSAANLTILSQIGDLAFGESFNCLEHAKTHDWIASIQGNVKAIPIINAIRRMGLAWIIPLLAPKKLLEMRQRNSRFTEDKVDQRLRCGTDRGDLWDGVMGSAEKQSMSREEMISNASAIVLAGSETSATLLSGATWLLGRHQDVLSKLEQHVRNAFNSEDEIDLVSVGRLDFLGAVLDEALRLYPPVPMQSNRVVNASGAIVAGYAVPAGVSLPSPQPRVRASQTKQRVPLTGIFVVDFGSSTAGRSLQVTEQLPSTQ